MMARIHALRRLLSHDSLSRNSTFLVASTLVSSLGGFLFWMVSARLATPTAVGVAAALIASANLLAMIGLVGMDMAVLNYTEANPATRQRTLSTGCGVVALATGLCAIAYTAGHGIFAPSLRVLDAPVHDLAFVVLVVAVSLHTFADRMFIALRESRYVLLRNVVVNGLRVVAPLGAVGLAGFGLFTGYAVPAALACLLAVVLLRKLGVPLRMRIHSDQLRLMWRYSVGNYVAMSLSSAPTLILPLIVAAGLGPRAVAVWSLPGLVSGLVAAVPLATGQSLFAELTVDPQHTGQHVRHAVRLTLIYQAPMLIGLIALGWPVLALFGATYTHGYLVLVILALSGVVGSIGFVARTLLLATGRLRVLTGTSLVFFVVSVSGAAAVVGLGINAVALSWLVAEIVTAVLYGVLVVAVLRRHAPAPIPLPQHSSFARAPASVVTGGSG